MLDVGSYAKKLEVSCASVGIISLDLVYFLIQPFTSHANRTVTLHHVLIFQ